MVYGYASTDEPALDGNVIAREALDDAFAEYKKWGNIREMHQPSAVGVARSIELDEKGAYLGAYVQDDDAWSKVKEGVYKGFSIGAKVTKRDDADRAIVRGMIITEISLVDRPADPGATFDLWRSADSDSTAEAETTPDAEDNPLADLIAGALAIIAAGAIESSARLLLAGGDVVTVEDAASLAAAVANGLDLAPLRGLAPQIGDLLAQNAVRAAKEALGRLNVILPAADNAALAEAVSDAARERAAQLTGQKFTVGGELAPDPSAENAITSSTRSMIGETIQSGLAGVATGVAAATLEELIRSAFAFSPSRAKGIGVTESNRAKGSAIVQTIQVVNESGAGHFMKAWMTADSGCCAACADNAAQGPIPADQPFSSGDMAPGAHTNCRCSVLTVPASNVGRIARRSDSEFDRKIAAVISETEEMRRSVLAILERMSKPQKVDDAVERRMVEWLSEPMPAKCALNSFARRAVDNTTDAAGSTIEASIPKLSDDDLVRALNAMPESERVMCLMRAAQLNPLTRH
ncbi:hypothetical protein CR492_01655 [Methylocella silvestris]|uniref:Phage head morphogenesis domain-containing protein n=2 Tax=Methylocella silvestris TaxID=199596 RepID=A0A2J7TLJ5_METSI|nr:hypothetical protein CR492_01655 [Methylocella silvestris]